MSRKSSSRDSTSKAHKAVSAGHAQALVADVEPTANSQGISVGWICLLVVALYWGDLYIMDHGGDLMGKGGSFPEEVYYPVPSFVALEELNPKVDLGPIKTGELLYVQKGCVTCHQSTGLGAPNQFPPLAGSEWVNAEGPNRLIRIVLDGLAGPITVSGKSFNGVMVPWRDTIKDDSEIAAILSFVRNSWGNQGSIVTSNEVTVIREATKSHANRAYTAAELEGIPPK